MYVLNEKGSREKFDFEKLVKSLEDLCTSKENHCLDCNAWSVAEKVRARIYNDITVREISELCADDAASMMITRPDFGVLACRILVEHVYKSTQKSFSKAIEGLYENFEGGLMIPLVSKEIYQIVKKNKIVLDKNIIYDRDGLYDYFGLKALERCMLTVQGRAVEAPQHMLMRVAVGIHKNDIESVLETYNKMSQLLFTHSFPTLLNAGTPMPHLSSCFLVCMEEDNTRETHLSHDCKCASGRYLEPWHCDIYKFLRRSKNRGKEEEEAPDLFYALWVPDLFMRRLEEGAAWSLFSPEDAPGLTDRWGQEFEDLYRQYESEGKAKKVVSARELWALILTNQFDFGTPSVFFKDTCNRKSNQRNLGTVMPSNLCTEIIEYTSTSTTETAVCVSASIALNRCVWDKPAMLVGSSGSERRFFEFDKLAEVASLVTKDLNKVIDAYYCPDNSEKKSNLRHRRIGIGVHGLADTFILLGLEFGSPQAQKLNKEIFETIYYHALKASSELAAKEGPYETYQGSPVSQGILQPDLWGISTSSDRLNWAALRGMISRNGIRNSLLVSPLPNASTSQILGNNECFEPYTSNTFKRRNLSGEFYVANKHLVHDLTARRLWPQLKNELISRGGSVCNISRIPDDLKAIYKTVWEIQRKTLINMAIDRGCYVDQTQILNIHVDHRDIKKLGAFYIRAWKGGLKSGVYHLTSHVAADASKEKSNVVGGKRPRSSHD